MNPLVPWLSALALSMVVAAAQNPKYLLIGNGCPGSMPISRLSLVTPPATGSTFQVDVTNLPANAAIMLTGFSRTASPFGPLPLQLSTYGMPGCVAYVSPDVLVFLSGTGNRAAFVLAIPASSGLVGLAFYQQALVLDPAAGNSTGAVVSDAACAVIGLPGWPTAPIANMVPIAAGSFWMGSAQGNWNERPVHTVNITMPFWMGKYEVTQAEYQAVMPYNPSWFQPPRIPAYEPSRPVEYVTWYNAMVYCATLTMREMAANRLPAGYQYRLPTEAEWEYCCRAGTTTEYNVGSTLSCGQANFFPSPSPACVGQTTVVGSYAANAWGLHDLHGNVREWCLDSWDGNPNYPAGPVADPYVTSGPYRVYRGGSWEHYALNCRSAYRDKSDIVGFPRGFGFRVVLAPVLVP